VESLTPAELAAFASLKDRELRAEGLVIAEGRLLVTRLLEAARRTVAGADPGAADARGVGNSGRVASGPALPRPGFDAIAVLCVPSLQGEFEKLAAGLCPVHAASEEELAGLAGFPFHRGVLAAARRRAMPALRDMSPSIPGVASSAASRLVVLPATIDPENMGSIMRSAAALGWDGILLGPGCCDHLSRRSLRVSMGAAFSLPTLRMSGPAELAALAASGWSLAAAVLDPGATPLRDWRAPERLALLIGNEFEGLGPEWLSFPDRGVEATRLTIPMDPGSDSLNAAAAAAVFLYETGLRPIRGK
jgi:tRNA G18 (ribose-2'-O)-methylase SpoU